MAEFVAGLILIFVFLSPVFVIGLIIYFAVKKSKNQSVKPNYPPYINNQQNQHPGFQGMYNVVGNQNYKNDFNANNGMNFNEFDNVDYTDYQITPYRARRLLTNHELQFYKVLKDIAVKRNLCVLSKIRLADLVEVEPMSDKKKSYGFFNKISRKHIDFALSNPEDLSVVVLIELDDFTHDKKQSDRDKFVEAVLEKAQYKLLRVRSTKDLENRLEEILL